MFTQIDIEAPTRLHLALIGMNNEGPRMNGGLGFTLKAPSLNVSISPNESIKLVDNRRRKLDHIEKNNIETLINQVCENAGLRRRAKITISGDAPSHSGFGIGTAVRLAAIEALHLFNGVTPSNAELIKHSRRGGTSGVGVRTYFEGGLTFDLGHKAGDRHRPSHAWEAPNTPLQLSRIDMPPWRIGVCINHKLHPQSHEQERNFFRSTLPISIVEAQRTLFVSLFGVFAAAAEKDVQTFVESIDELQFTAWKAAEWRLYGTPLLDTATELRKAGATGLGLSSIGPALFFIANAFRIDSLPQTLRHSVFLTEPGNSGRRVIAHE